MTEAKSHNLIEAAIKKRINQLFSETSKKVLSEYLKKEPNDSDMKLLTVQRKGDKGLIFYGATLLGEMKLKYQGITITVTYTQA